MNKVTITLDGASAFKQRIQALGPAIEAAVREAIANGAVWVQEAAIRAIKEGPKTGHITERGKKYDKASERWHNVTHQASAPGEAPAADTGELWSNIVVRSGDDDLTTEVVSKAPYSFDLEFGTSVIAPRPFMMPALEANRERINNAVRAAMRGAL